jgi:hypothetical protein
MIWKCFAWTIVVGFSLLLGLLANETVEMLKLGEPRPVDVLGNAQQFRGEDTAKACIRRGGTPMYDAEADVYVLCYGAH